MWAALPIGQLGPVNSERLVGWWGVQCNVQVDAIVGVPVHNIALENYETLAMVLEIESAMGLHWAGLWIALNCIGVALGVHHWL